MSFEWDESKRRLNLRNHQVDFADIFPLFNGDFLERIDDRRDYGEIRFRCLGEVNGRIYVVIYTWRNGNRRIISVRKANGKEQREYYSRHA